MPKFPWDSSTKGRSFPYQVFGAACTEVQIDCLTGNHEVLRTDMVMDVGKSLNPAVDIGQVNERRDSIEEKRLRLAMIIISL